MIGSHNTFSYLTPKSWWMKLLSPWSKCQKDSVNNQIHGDSVKYIDIRVKFINGLPVFVHNNIIYKANVKSTLVDIVEAIAYCRAKPVYCRIILDIRKKPKDADEQVRLFKELLKWLNSNLLVIDEARIFWDWNNPLIKSKYNIVEVHTSVCSKWYQYILGTKWFANKHNKETLELEKSNPDTVFLIDYVNIH